MKQSERNKTSRSASLCGSHERKWVSPFATLILLCLILLKLIYIYIYMINIINPIKVIRDLDVTIRLDPYFLNMCVGPERKTNYKLGFELISWVI